MARKEPWETCPEVWKTRAAYFNWLRGCLRLAWKRHPVKIKFLKRNTFRAPIGKQIDRKTGTPKLVNAGVCACCGGTFRVGKLQVDHIVGAGSFQGWDDMTAWVRGLMSVALEDLQYLCKECHNIKSYAERSGMTMEQAALEKEVIKFKKLKGAEQAALLTSKNITPGANAALRTAQYRKHIND